MSSRAQAMAVFLSVLVPLAGAAAPGGPQAAEQQARAILQTCQVTGGLVVHLGCGGGKLTAALHASDAYLVHGLDPEAANVERATRASASLGLAGVVAVDRLTGSRLPYIDNLVNLVVAEGLGHVPKDEVMRVLCPSGVAYIKEGGAVDQDCQVPAGYAGRVDALPARPLEQCRLPRQGGRSAAPLAVDRRPEIRASSRPDVEHECRRLGGWAHLNIVNKAPRLDPAAARVGTGGAGCLQRHRSLEAAPGSLADAPVAAQKRSGRVARLVAGDDCVYVTLSLDGPLTALAAATGRTIRTYEGTKATEEVLCSDGTLFALVNEHMNEPAFANLRRSSTPPAARSGMNSPGGSRPSTPTAAMLSGTSFPRVCRARWPSTGNGCSFMTAPASSPDRSSGETLWRSQPIGRCDILRSSTCPRWSCIRTSFSSPAV